MGTTITPPSAQPKNAAAHTAAETMERLPLRADVERWRFFLMKWAERFEICARALQRKIRTNYFDDIVRRGDLLYCF